MRINTITLGHNTEPSCLKHLLGRPFPYATLKLFYILANTIPCIHVKLKLFIIEKKNLTSYKFT